MSRPGSPVTPMGGQRRVIAHAASDTGSFDETPWFDPETGVNVVNESDVPWGQIRQAPEIAALVSWAQTNFGNDGRQGRDQGIFQRDRYVSPTTIFGQFDLARWASETDDVVGGVLESTESLAFSKTGFSADDEDEEDLWNQIAADIDLDSRLREMWRELFIASQFYVAVYWGKKDYKVRGKTDKGVQRKKVWADLMVPLGMTILDPKKVIPVGSFMFNKEDLVYLADGNESETFKAVLGGASGGDQVIRQMILKQFEPSEGQLRWLNSMGIAAAGTDMFLLNPQNVFRHTLTRPQFEPYAAVRMKGVFRLLDLKAQLMEMDRSFLLGGTNFIVLVKKGSDNLPATTRELQGLANQVRRQSRVPIMVGDHRLSVEIVTPDVDLTLQPAKYDALDSRISAALYHMLLPTGGTNTDDSSKLARVIARSMESRRHMIRRTLEATILKRTVDQNEGLTQVPTLDFHPKRIALDFDQGLATYLLELRDRGEISRDTLLSEFDYTQKDEAIKLEREEEKYDDIFQTRVPFSGAAAQPGGAAPKKPAANADPRSGGRNGGGNRSGGGAAPGTGQGKAKGTK